MKRQHLTLLGMMLALLLLVGACGSDDESGSAGTTAGETTGESVSGSISVIGVWTGPEQKSFQAVIDGFTAKNPDATVKYTSGGDNIVTVLSTAVEGGNPPDIATVSQPGTMADFVSRKALKPLDFARTRSRRTSATRSSRSAASTTRSTACSSRRPTSRPSGTTSRRSTTPASRRRTTWDDFLTDAKTIKPVRRPGLLDRRRRRLDAHRPLREHLPPHRGRRDLRQAGEARDPVDRSVGQGRARRDGEGRRRHRQHRRRQGGRPADGLPDLGRERLLQHPEGGDGDRGRLRPRRRRRQESAQAGDGLQHLPVPVDQRLARLGRRRRRPRRDVQGQPGREGVHRVPDDAGGLGDLGEARRLLVAEQEGRQERVSGSDPARRRQAQSARRRSSASTCPTCSRPRSAAPSARGSSSCSRTS